MKHTGKMLILAGVIAAVFLGFNQGVDLFQGDAVTLEAKDSGHAALAEALAKQASGVQVTGSGMVVRTLSDDNDGSRHQRFVVQLESGQTLLIAHNIDIAPRLVGLRKGDRISFKGEYEWNAKGGVVHWTHRDPGGNHPAGWLEYGGNTYQ